MKKICLLVAAALFAVSASAQLITSTTTVTERKIEREKKNVTVWYQGEVNLGFATAGKMKFTDGGESYTEKTDFSRPLISTVHGVRITPYAFVGLGVGAQFAYGHLYPEDPEDGNWNTLLIPAFLNLKGYYPINDDFAPYISVSLGTSFCATSDINNSYDGWSEKLKGGFYGEYGLGINYKKLNFGFGMLTQGLKFVYEERGYSESEKASSTSFYVKIGLKF